jgi:hypothetical protein
MGREKVLQTSDQLPPRVSYKSSNKKRTPGAQREFVVRTAETVHKAPGPKPSVEPLSFDPGIDPDEALFHLNEWDSGPRHSEGKVDLPIV